MSKITTKKNILIVALCCLMTTELQSNARVSFSRPASIMRTPGSNINTTEQNKYLVGFSTEILGLASLTYAPAAYFQGLNIKGYNFGVSYSSHAEAGTTGGKSSLGFHIHKQVYKRNNMLVSVGIHDILYSSPHDHRLSIFSTFSQGHQINNNYFLEYSIGFGSGYLSEDSHVSEESNTGSPANFFVSIKVDTPIMQEKGGLKLLAEYDGWGLNVGTTIPINESWAINVGITHFENLAKFGDNTNIGNSLISDAPAIAFGFQMKLPKINYNQIEDPSINWDQAYSYKNNDEAIDSLVGHANTIIAALEDSIMLQNEEITTLNALNQSLVQKTNALLDSLDGQELANKILQSNLNKAMKQLSKSLEAYYQENYAEALQEVDKALNIYPELAISYARKGSIYYKLGDRTRATINWNIALKLDPEYDEVRNMLQSLKNNETTNNKLPE